jgi:hypothetical protein
MKYGTGQGQWGVDKYGVDPTFYTPDTAAATPVYTEE